MLCALCDLCVQRDSFTSVRYHRPFFTGEASMHTSIRIVSGAALFLAATTIADVRAQTRATVRPADLVLRGGKIVTVDEARPVAEAIAVSGDTIVAVGPESEIQ